MKKNILLFGAGFVAGFVAPLWSLVVNARDGEVIAESDTMEYRLCKDAENIAIAFKKNSSEE